MQRWFDAHLDLACLALCGRDMAGEPSAASGPFPPASVTLPSLRRGGVTHALATIFTEPDGADAPIAYPSGDAAAAHRVGRQQLDEYQRWIERGWCGRWHDPAGPVDATPRIAILIEGADPIRQPDELAWWAERGVVAVSLAWWKQSRYAGGNGTRTGLTSDGRALAAEIDRRNLVHDVSHLSDRSFDELMGVISPSARVIASHSNSRALMGDPDNQRHLREDQIRQIARRGGVIGLNLYSRFLSPRCSERGRATLDDCVSHIEHIAGVAGGRQFVGLGSDMDGGFGGDRLPGGIDGPEHLERLAEALTASGWRQAEVDGFRWGNWARYFGLVSTVTG